MCMISSSFRPNNIDKAFFPRFGRRDNTVHSYCPSHGTEGQYLLDVAVSCHPQPGKMNKNGEDAFFVSKKSTSIGVFDGVGGWAELNIDPSAYSNRLCQEVEKYYDVEGVEDPVELLQRACEQAEEVTGSRFSTACLVVVRNKKLFAANVGDSRFVVIRNGSAVLASKEQQIEWNVPFQMGAKSNIFPKTHADAYELDLELNDMLVMGSDGLFDNLFLEEIVSLLDGESSCAKMAKAIAKLAKKKSLSANTDTPFKREAFKAQKLWGGGKPDDITVIVARVTEAHESKDIP